MDETKETAGPTGSARTERGRLSKAGYVRVWGPRIAVAAQVAWRIYRLWNGDGPSL